MSRMALVKVEKSAAPRAAELRRGPRSYGSVTAPRSAPVTNRAYLASTPVL
jgi:hypothetical protein